MKELFKQPDHDTFGMLTGGLRNNWPLLMALFGIGWWIITSVSASQNINVVQDGKIEATAKAVSELTINVTSLANQFQTNVRANDTANNEILRRLDLVQKDIDIIKTQK